MPIITDPLHYLRKDRDTLLANCDWKMTRALELDEKVDEWKKYRKDLRDLPESADPKWTTEDGLTNVTWPTEPS